MNFSLMIVCVEEQREWKDWMDTLQIGPLVPYPMNKGTLSCLCRRDRNGGERFITRESCAIMRMLHKAVRQILFMLVHIETTVKFNPLELVVTV